MDSSAPPPDEDGLDALDRRFDDAMSRARARAAALARAVDELATLRAQSRDADVAQSRTRLLDDVVKDLDR